jgi:hypothetical protein
MPMVMLRTHDKHPAFAIRILIEIFRLPRQQFVVAHNNAVERGTSRANPFATLHDRERSILLEIEAEAFGSKDKNFAHQICCPGREPDPNRPVGEPLVPNLILDIVEEMFRKVGLDSLSHKGPR